MLLFAIFLFQISVTSGILRREDAVQDILFHDYNRYNTILTYLKTLYLNYPEKIKIMKIGESSEGRKIVAVKISNNHKAENKTAILIDAGMHAREWMSPAVALYLIYQLVQNKTNEYMNEDVDWYIIPLLNPDGYEYSRLHNNKWRKTRSVGHNCIGVDINRNFDFHWQKDANQNECSSSYRGPKPFSEPETRAIRDLASKYQQNIKLYVTIHSYATLLLYPWSAKKTSIKNEAEHIFVGKSVIQAIQNVRGTQYNVGNIYDLLYSVPGSSCDWMAGVMKIPLCFGLELPEGVGKFHPNPAEILPTAKETFEGFRAFHNYIKLRHLLVF